MIKIVSNREMQQLDSHTINEIGIPGMVLMENAGKAVFDASLVYYNQIGEKGAIHIFCGKGNNGGDGYVIGRYFFNSGYPVEIITIADPESLRGDALSNYRICRTLGLPIHHVATIKELKKRTRPAFIIDALLGTGIHGPASGFTAEVIAFINACNAAVVAVDIPSGLSGDTMSVTGPAVRADITVTMAFPKRAHIFEPARSLVGKLVVADIGIPAALPAPDVFQLNYVESGDIELPPIAGNENKYSAGKLFILAGSPGMTGAAVLSAQGALYSGAGLIVVGIPKNLNSVMESKVTEALTHPLPETSSGALSMDGIDAISERVAWADAVLIGPGLGRDSETMQLVLDVCSTCNRSNKPTVVDADALFALSRKREIVGQLKNLFLLTPHHGEFIRLSGAAKTDMASEPWRCLQDFLKDKSVIVNLKGAPSMVGEPAGACYVNSTGNPALAKGGSGDVLSGICAGLMARGLSPMHAAICANYIHGLAADKMAEQLGVVSALPSDLFTFLPHAIKALTDKGGVYKKKDYLP